MAEDYMDRMDLNAQQLYFSDYGKGKANGVAPLDNNGKVSPTYLEIKYLSELKVSLNDPSQSNVCDWLTRLKSSDYKNAGISSWKNSNLYNSASISNVREFVASNNSLTFFVRTSSKIYQAVYDNQTADLDQPFTLTELTDITGTCNKIEIVTISGKEYVTFATNSGGWIAEIELDGSLSNLTQVYTSSACSALHYIGENKWLALGYSVLGNSNRGLYVTDNIFSGIFQLISNGEWRYVEGTINSEGTSACVLTADAPGSTAGASAGVYYTLDGESINSAISLSTPTVLAFNGESFICRIWNDTTQTIWTSTDGITWTPDNTLAAIQTFTGIWWCSSSVASFAHYILGNPGYSNFKTYTEQGVELTDINGNSLAITDVISVESPDGVTRILLKTYNKLYVMNSYGKFEELTMPSAPTGSGKIGFQRSAGIVHCLSNTAHYSGKYVYAPQGRL